MFHKKLRKQRKTAEDGGALQFRTYVCDFAESLRFRRCKNREVAEEAARDAAQTGDEYVKLVAEGTRYMAKEDYRKAAKVNREAIALKPDEPAAYYNLGNALSISGHLVEAAQRYLEAKERCPVGSELWAIATAAAFVKLNLEECDEVAKPEWWNDEELKVLSAKVMRAAHNHRAAHCMRAEVLGICDSWVAGPRSAAELQKAAEHFDRAATLCNPSELRDQLVGYADWCRSQPIIGQALMRCTRALVYYTGVLHLIGWG